MRFVCWNCAQEGDKAWAAAHLHESGHRSSPRQPLVQEYLWIVQIGDRVQLFDGREGVVIEIADEDDGGFWVRLDENFEIVYEIVAKRVRA